MADKGAAARSAVVAQKAAATGPALADPRDAAAAAGAYSSPSEAYTSDGEGGGGGGGSGGERRAWSDDEEDAGVGVGGPGATGGSGLVQARAAAGRRAGGRGSKGGACGVSNGKPPTRTAPPVLLLLAGLPGSGKSTFSRELLRSSPVAWVHVNQDSIRDGKPGTREQCLEAARAALEGGACCVVDRTHADVAQRSALRVLATERGLAAHCVALQPPAELCARRVVARTDHPGGLQGDGSARVVFTMAGQMKKKNSWPPAAAEGFASVMDCHNDADAAAAVRAWAAYGSTGAVAQPAESGSPLVAAPAAAAAAAPTLRVWQDHVAKRKPASEGIKSFFKPAGTAARQSPGSDKASAGGKAAADSRTSGALAARGFAAASAPGGSAAGHRGGEASRKAAAGAAAAAKSLAPDTASPPSLRRPRDEPLAGGRGAKRQAVEQPEVGGGGSSGRGSAAIPAVSVPRVNDSPTGSSLEGLPGGGGGSASQRSGEGGGDSQSGRNAFAVLMASASRKAADGRGGGGGGGGGSTGDGVGDGGAKSTQAGDEPDTRFKLSSSWAQALRNAALHPEQSQQEVLYIDDEVVMIRDAYPKAKHHVLVIARDPALRSIADLRRQHRALLEHMQQVACQWVQETRSKDAAAVAFKLGFHAVPSMCQVHMHVVSQDFDSPALKNKKHWNSFNTKFFLPVDTVCHELESRGRLTLIDQDEQQQLEGQELRCHGCSKPIKNMPELKKHVVACDAVKRLPGL